MINPRNGRNIKKLKQRIFEIKIIDDFMPNSQEKVMVVSRKDPEQGYPYSLIDRDLEQLLVQINKIIGKPVGYALYDPENTIQEEYQATSTLQSMVIPLQKKLVGAVIGKEGSTIKKLRDEYNVKIHVKPARGERRDVVIYGSQDDMERVKTRIEEICEAEKQRLDELGTQTELEKGAQDQGELEGEAIQKHGELKDIQEEPQDVNDTAMHKSKEEGNLSEKMKKISIEE
jgi:predicted PilT family ATPase